MLDIIPQLCQIIAETLRERPQATGADLMTQVERAIAANPQLEAALRTEPEMLQINRDGAKGFQTWVKQGGIANIGEHYHLSDPEQLKAALEAVLLQLQAVYQPVGIAKNLPDRTQQFVGREAVLADLHTLLQQTERVYLQGMGGIGKTELALQYAWQHYEQGTYPAGICWLRAKEQNLGTQIVNFARVHLGLKVRDDLELPERVADCWQRWTSGNVLVVFDDVWKYEEIAPYLPPQETRFKVLLTTRSYLGHSAKQFEIQVLSQEAALDFLRLLVTPQRIDQQLDAAQVLAQWLGYLPLSLELVGRYLAQRSDLSLVKMQQRLENQRLAARALCGRAADMTAEHESVAAAFQLSWQDLTASAQQLCYVLSLFALAPIPWNLVEQSLPMWDAEDLEDRQSELVNGSLLQRVEECFYQLHQLVREFFIAKRENAAATQASSFTMLKQQVCQVMVTVAQQVSGSPTQQEILSTTPFMPHVVEVVTTLVEALKNEALIWPFVGLGRFYAGQGGYVQAEPWYEQCLSVVRTRLGDEHPAVATSLNNLALLYYKQGRYVEAEPLLQQALAMRQRLLGQEHLDVATSLNCLAALYKNQGRYTEAEPLLQQALAMRQRLLGQEHPDVASSLNNLAALYNNQGRYTEAEPLYLQALAMYQRLLGQEHPDVASSLNNLALLYDNQGRYTEAEPLYLQALAMRQRLLGQEHLDVASSLNNLALLYNNQGRYTEAEPLYLQALAMYQRLLGQEHLDVASSLNNLAALYNNQGRYTEAEPLLQQALAMYQRLLGQEHPDVASSLNNLAALYNNQGRYTEAEPLYLQALAMYQRLLGQEHPDVASSLNNLAALYDNQGRYTEAEPLLQQALAMRQRLLGQEHLDVATSLNNLAALYDNQGRYTEAEPLLQQALAMRQRLLGQEHPDVASSLNNLAALYNNQGRYAEAELLYLQALAMRQRLLGQEHLDVASSLNNLAALYKNQGRYTEAEPLYLQALAMYQRLLGQGHPSTAVSLWSLGALYTNQSRLTEAEPLLLRALEVFQQALGPDHSWTTGVQQSLSRLQQAME